jgi:dynein heavy chain
LSRTFYNQKKKPYIIDLNPKAVTNGELFGVINPSTREWKDGLLAVIIRDVSNMTSDGPKWIILDGDIDPGWTESLNSVMDDNKVLTLASNERISLTPTMRLLFEVSHLKYANPATVSRAGILYINPEDLGWRPFISSWIDTRESHNEKGILHALFEKFLPTCMDKSTQKFKQIIPISEISQCQILCTLLECLLTQDMIGVEPTKELYEHYFVFCCVWSFGAALFQDYLIDHRLEFHKWWTNEFKLSCVKFPAAGTVFDYFIDPDTKRLELWTDMVINEGGP